MLQTLHEFEGLELSFFSIVFFVVVILLFVKEFREIYLYFKKWADGKVVESLSQDEINEITKENKDNIIKLQESFESLNTTVNCITEQVENLREENQRARRAELKNRIAAEFKVYDKRKFSEERPAPFWSEMEKEAFEDLIDSYEDNGGKNSFVHTVVAPTTPTWIVISNEEMSKRLDD